MTLPPVNLRTSEQLPIGKIFRLTRYSILEAEKGRWTVCCANRIPFGSEDER
ncbi:hypothetical protein RISK_005569 [Rhodopirellula islandica]|uniref:Uncharacterized protein n=1 Tax=Rhodopirellula islandica TaxID=595434 RepID=A0A0J1B7F0_RHOIS|nr:hypothetical protein RISK_005569 [Rhodopirellula islandica]